MLADNKNDSTAVTLFKPCNAVQRNNNCSSVALCSLVSAGLFALAIWAGIRTEMALKTEGTKNEEMEGALLAMVLGIVAAVSAGFGLRASCQVATEWKEGRRQPPPSN